LSLPPDRSGLQPGHYAATTDAVIPSEGAQRPSRGTPAFASAVAVASEGVAARFSRRKAASPSHCHSAAFDPASRGSNAKESASLFWRSPGAPSVRALRGRVGCWVPGAPHLFRDVGVSPPTCCHPERRREAPQSKDLRDVHATTAVRTFLPQPPPSPHLPFAQPSHQTPREASTGRARVHACRNIQPAKYSVIPSEASRASGSRGGGTCSCFFALSFPKGICV